MTKAADYQKRLESLLETKEKETKRKILKFGRTLDFDDRGNILPPDDFAFVPESNHPSGGFFGPRASGANYRRLLETHPVSIDSNSSLAGAWMAMLYEKRNPMWNPDFDFSHLHREQKLYDIVHGIGGPHHFLADYALGMELGFQKTLEKIASCKEKNSPGKNDFYDALTDCILGMQDFVRRHALKAGEMADQEKDPARKATLWTMHAMNLKLVNDPPETFHEAVQWMAWYMMAANIYNGCGSAIGEIDAILKPYYDRDKALGILDDEQAIFHICCLLLKDNAYCQVGGCDSQGRDKTNEISYLVLEAIHRMKIPSSICVRVHEGLDEKFLYLAVRYLFEDQKGAPNFIGDKAINQGFIRNGYPMELAVSRIKCGCHWCAIPGREYTLNDVVKINFAAVFRVSLDEMMADGDHTPGIDRLWDMFLKHLKRAIEVTAEGIDFHLEHMHEVFPELPNDLYCHGTIEKGLDATHGGVEYYNMCVDGAGLAVVADSFSALEQRVEREKRITWEKLMEVLDNDYLGHEDIRMMMKNVPRYGIGNSRADAYAQDIVRQFVGFVKEKPTPMGFNMIPGLFSWANTIPMGKAVKATPDGRHAYAPISHGANPQPGFKETGALTAMANAVALVQCGYGNTAPIQLEINPMVMKGEEGIGNFVAFIKAYCNQMDGTLMNINIFDKEKILEAHKDPSLYPDLVVRVTGFSAYFAALSEDFRKLVVDRIINE
ncbi:MAG: pyruvate formate lyase family protein [Clostridia bacterium]